jgi:hypothetical protein
MKQKGQDYRVMEVGSGTTAVGAGKIYAPVSKMKAEEDKDKLSKEGISAIFFAVDEQGRALKQVSMAQQIPPR